MAKVTCGDCKKTGAPVGPPVAAAQLAKTHDRLIHRGHPTAKVTK